MLESVRQNSRSAIIYILFGILIAAFIVSFGPGSMSTDSMFDIGSKYAAKIQGSEISEQDYNFAYIALIPHNVPEQAVRAQRIREQIMDRLIERELFAHEAEKMGLQVGEEEAANQIADGKMLVAGVQRPVESYAFRGGKFDYDKFRQVVQNSYRITVKQFMEIQRRELLANRYRQLMLQETRASMDEVKADFEDKNRQINIEYVRFSPYRYEQDLAPSETDVENWAREHEDKIKKVYEERKMLYQKQEKSVQARRILIEVKKDAAEPEVAAARAKLDSARKTLESGTRFADVARTTSEDAPTRGKGGDLGWRKKGFTDFGSDVEAKVFAAKAGDLLGPERTERGLELIKVEGFREGDISLGQARGELALELYRTEKAKELAENAALEAVRKLKEGGKLADLFPKNDSDSAEAQPRANRIQVEETGLFARKGDMVQGIGASAAMANAAFRLKPGEWLGPSEVASSFIVATLKERKEPDLVDFEKRKDELAREYARAKWGSVMAQVAHSACVDAQAAGKIKVNQSVLQYEGAAKGPEKLLAALKYEPCREKPF